MDKTCIITRATSGSGKSTFADFARSGWWNPHDVGICCADDHFMVDGEYKFNPSELGDAHRDCRGLFNSYVDLECPVIIVANTNTQEKEFKYYEDLAKERGYTVMHIVLENRHGNSDVHGVPNEVKERQKNNLLNSLQL